MTDDPMRRSSAGEVGGTAAVGIELGQDQLAEGTDATVEIGVSGDADAAVGTHGQRFRLHAIGTAAERDRCHAVLAEARIDTALAAVESQYVADGAALLGAL